MSVNFNLKNVANHFGLSNQKIEFAVYRLKWNSHKDPI